MNRLKTILKDYYEIETADIFPQKGGWAALAYKVSSDKHSYFLKVYEKSRASTPKWTALIDEYAPIMKWLDQHSGLKGKIPVPLLTKHGEYKCEDEDGIYLLYEYIDGETIGDQDLTGEQARQLSEIVTELHTYGEGIPVKTDAIREDFHVPFLPQLRSALDQDSPLVPSDVREAIAPRLAQVNLLADAVEQLSLRLKGQPLRMALCHTDIHPWNLMQSGRQLILIDWEGLRLAPVEADLMFLVEEPYYEDFLALYRKRHRHFEVNLEALQFYRGRRKLEDIWEFIEQLLFDEQAASARAATLRSLAEELKDVE
ncbi:aminoglycoside phosphotransferase family protein [Cohnella sp. REN36]|uniref:aminoglycoside phosphotransferase family protein n=1 Tax=Cohnella sp. REN36 TaxID=2887347 RepID=UPI001D13D945|nr:aminoglycoside phosphotransferase family protein [Cohnella sp. REN36]MCC3372506.1 aminoglycoside phosphotransferase family protein [Cohnella sp. REN36]